MVRHLLSIADLTAVELKTLVNRGTALKKQIRAGDYSGSRPLAGQQIAMLFSKRSTRTRISTEGATVYLGASPMFLGRDDIQLGVNESFHDTSRIVSSMTSAIVARVGEHSEVEELSKWSSVPVINALSAQFHPTQAIADLITIQDAFTALPSKVAWVGDANNVLYDLALACVKMGISISAATPSQHPVDPKIVDLVSSHAEGGAELLTTTIPEEAVKDADILVTDTWISMGQEAEKQQRLREFSGFQVTEDLAKRGGAKPDWKFMHCLPRKSEEVDDEVFFGPRSLVFEEGENRLYSAIAVLEAFVVNKGKF